MTIKNIINFLSLVVFLFFIGVSLFLLSNNSREESILGITDQTVSGEHSFVSDEKIEIVISDDEDNFIFIRTFGASDKIFINQLNEYISISPNSILFLNRSNKVDLFVVEGTIVVGENVVEKNQRLVYIAGQWELFETNTEKMLQQGFIRKLGEKLWDEGYVDEQLDFLIPKI